jgi:hypothetical protein
VFRCACIRYCCFIFYAGLATVSSLIVTWLHYFMGLLYFAGYRWASESQFRFARRRSSHRVVSGCFLLVSWSWVTARLTIVRFGDCVSVGPTVAVLVLEFTATFSVRLGLAVITGLFVIVLGLYFVQSLRKEVDHVA